MPAEASTKLLIHFELIDKATAEARRNLQQVEAASKKTNAEVKKGFEESENSLKSFERGLSSVSKSTAILSAAILGPLGFAVNAAAKSNYELFRSLNDIKDSTDDVVKSIGVSMAPIIKDVAAKVRELSNAWLNLSNEQRNNIIQVVAWTGGVLAAVSVSTQLAGALIKIGALLASPGGMIAVGLAAIAVLSATLVDQWAKLNNEILTFGERWQRIIGVALAAENPLSGISQIGFNTGEGLGKAAGKRLFGGSGTDQDPVDLGVIKASKQSGAVKAKKDELDDLGKHAMRVADEIGNKFMIMSDTYMKSLGGIAGITMTVLTTAIDGVTKGLGDSVAQAIVYGKDFSESMQAALKSLAAQIISFLVSTIAKIIVLRAMGVVGPISTGALGIGGGGGGGGAASGGGGGVGGFFKSIFGFAQGGTITEPIFGVGMRSGAGYTFGEKGPENISPIGRASKGGGNSIHIEVNNPIMQTKQNIDDLAEAISRKFARESARA